MAFAMGCILMPAPGATAADCLLDTNNDGDAGMNIDTDGVAQADGDATPSVRH
jgi:hypothetical protein